MPVLFLFCQTICKFSNKSAGDRFYDRNECTQALPSTLTVNIFLSHRLTRFLTIGNKINCALNVF